MTPQKTLELLKDLFVPIQPYRIPFLILGSFSSIEHGLGPFLVGILVWAVGLGLGGTTGYAINPARDLGPRIMHAILPIPNKGSSDWSYAWIPVLGPAAGAVLGAFILTLN
jgi:glycerol uptake facilitator protein